MFMAPRLFVLVFTAAALLAACGGGGGTVTPSTPTPAPSATATATPTPSATATPTPAGTATPTPAGTATPTPAGTSTPAAAVFTGGTQTQSFTSSGGTFTMSAADNGYTASATFGSNNATSAFNFTMAWATFAQITGTFTPGALPTTIGTALLYLDFKSAATVDFTTTPAVTVTTTGSFPGTKCGFAVYGVPGSGTGGTASWFSQTQVGIAEVSPAGNSFTVPAASLGAGNNVQFDAGSDQYITVYCH
jgi:hypothetical protein